MPGPHKLAPLAHHMVSPRPGRAPILALALDEHLMRCPICQQPVSPPYRVVGMDVVHPHCATDLALGRLEAKVDLLLKRLNHLEHP